MLQQRRVNLLILRGVYLCDYTKKGPCHAQLATPVGLEPGRNDDPPLHPHLAGPDAWLGLARGETKPGLAASCDQAAVLSAGKNGQSCAAAVTTPYADDSMTMIEALPKRFTGIDTWPKETNLLCWNCGLRPEGRPRFVALNPERVCIDSTAHRYVCDPHGCFCSANCVVSYIRERLPHALVDDAIRVLPRFEAQFTGVLRPIITAAPPRTLMRHYCGPGGLTVAQWRAERDRIDRDYSLVQHRLEDFAI